VLGAPVFSAPLPAVGQPFLASFLFAQWRGLLLGVANVSVLPSDVHPQRRFARHPRGFHEGLPTLFTGYSHVIGSYFQFFVGRFLFSGTNKEL
jgi:hypothetical protein